MGFDFVHFGLTGTTMTDGHLTPLGHDGMAAFPGPDGTTRLVRYREDRNIALLSTPSGSAAKRYDQQGGGGTSTLQVRTLPDGNRALEKDFMSISGTIVNCAGGPTPWGSWLTCEETTEGRVVGARLENHGYMFEVPSIAEVMSFPDNITVSPRGTLVVCEDPLANDFHRLIGVTRDGRTFELCHAEQGVEWAGATFAPDSRTLFANLQGSTVGNPRLGGVNRLKYSKTAQRHGHDGHGRLHLVVPSRVVG